MKRILALILCILMEVTLMTACSDPVRETETEASTETETETEEIEALLCANPFVREAVVVGRIDESQKDYELVAVIHPDYDAVRQVYGQNFVPENVEGELDAALESANEQVAPHKRLKAYIVRDSAFPKDATRKIRRSSAAEDVKRGEGIV